jgi:radical SAM/Cys-rich protein
MVPSFRQRLQEVDPAFAVFDGLQTLQVNLGNLCNLSCTHCHVNASHRGTEIMTRPVMARVIAFLSRHPGLTLDITGGCPEMNPDFRWFVEETDGLTAGRLLRSNLAIMAEPEWGWLPGFCRDHRMTVIGSLPCYLEENVDRQRGDGVYRQSIKALQALNAVGYGTDLELDLVYNPGGDFVPGSQSVLEQAYKKELSDRHGILFDHLFTITNAPVGRFRDRLQADGRLDDYLRLLAGRFNPEAAGRIMCRWLLSVDWEGTVYNCDFNQALRMPVTAADGTPVTIETLDRQVVSGSTIRLAQHCYCCTAGEGSSCTGALVG